MTNIDKFYTGSLAMVVIGTAALPCVVFGVDPSSPAFSGLLGAPLASIGIGIMGVLGYVVHYECCRRGAPVQPTEMTALLPPSSLFSQLTADMERSTPMAAVPSALLAARDSNKSAQDKAFKLS